jgi:O-antigen/teichoic acid export membrane protein
MSEKFAESKEVAAKAVLAVVALGTRQIFVHGLNLLGNVMLARLLSPTDFGVYAVVIFLITFLGTFGGTGLASNLIRSPESPSEVEYASVFAAQQSILLVVTAVLLLISPKITRLYHLPPSYVWLFWLAALSLLITSFMVIPQIKLERELAFSKLAVAEVWQTAAFNGCAIFMAWKHWGSMAFAIALLARSLTGVFVLFLVEPWLPQWHWDWELIRKNLSFGFYYQLSQIASLLKDAITPILIGLVLGAASVGYTSWASMLASYPVLALMILQRVYLPVFSRLQHEPAMLKRFVEKVILATNGIAAPLSVFLLALIVPISNLVYGSKWDTAIPLFLLFWVTNLFTPTATPLLALLNTMGASRIVFGFTIAWMVLTWLIGIPLVLWLGAIGLAYANVCVQLSNLIVLPIVKRRLPIAILPSVAPGWILASLIGAALWIVNRHYPIHSIHVLIFCFGCGSLLYAAGMLYWHGEELRSLLPQKFNRTQIQ